MNSWILHADDFGETNEITEGIRVAMEGGVVTSTSVMANMPGTPMALKLAKNGIGDGSFGLHLNLCEGQALTDGSSLVDDRGYLPKKRQLFLKAVSGGLKLKDVSLEIEAQLSVLTDSGIKVSHLDAHKHLHQLPVVRHAVCRVLPRFGIQRVRVSRERSGWRTDKSLSTNLSRLVRQSMARRSANIFTGAGLSYPDCVVDLGELMTVDPELFAAKYSDTLLEVFCHPGTQQADIDKPGSCNRFEELEFLMSDRFQIFRSAANAKLVNYWAVSS